MQHDRGKIQEDIMTVSYTHLEDCPLTTPAQVRSGRVLLHQNIFTFRRFRDKLSGENIFRTDKGEQDR